MICDKHTTYYIIHITYEIRPERADHTTSYLNPKPYTLNPKHIQHTMDILYHIHTYNTIQICIIHIYRIQYIYMWHLEEPAAGGDTVGHVADFARKHAVKLPRVHVCVCVCVRTRVVCACVSERVYIYENISINRCIYMYMCFFVSFCTP